MTKKNTRSCSHKRIKAALCAAMCSALTAMPAFATNGNNAAATTGTTVWTKASEIIRMSTRKSSPSPPSQLLSVPPLPCC